MRKGNARLGNRESFKPDDRSFIRTFPALRSKIFPGTVVTRHPSSLVRHARLMCLSRHKGTNVRLRTILVIPIIHRSYLPTDICICISFLVGRLYLPRFYRSRTTANTRVEASNNTFPNISLSLGNLWKSHSVAEQRGAASATGSVKSGQKDRFELN